MEGTYRSTGYVYIYFQRQNDIAFALVINLKDNTASKFLLFRRGKGKKALYETKGSLRSVKAGFTSPNLKCLRVRFLVIGGHLVHIYRHWRRTDYFRGSFFPFALDINPRSTESGSAAFCLSFH